VSSRIWVQHPELRDERGRARVQSVPAAALRQLGTAGWVQLDENELAAYEQRCADDRAERVEALTAPSARSVEPPLIPAPAPRKSRAVREAASTETESDD
jgi:hypothetical protein